MNFIRRLFKFLLFSIIYAGSIDYNIDHNNLILIDNHFILDGSNSTLKIESSTFDIHRLSFILNKNSQINYTIKNIKWIKSDYKLNESINKDLITKNEIFNHKGCPTAYLDIFPYKLDEYQNLYYIGLLEIEFTFNDIVVEGFCDIPNNIKNKEFISVNKPNRLISDIEYIIVTNNILSPAAESLKLIHTDLSIEIILIDDIISLYDNLEISDAIREYLISRIDLEPNLKYLLILGDENIVPPLYNGSTPSDDYYTSSGNFSANPQLSTGRISVNNINDANNIILKIESYINNLFYPIDEDQSWRMNISFISDDENNPNPDKYPELSHTENSSLLYEQMNQNLIINTFYGIDYVPIQNSDGLLHVDLTSDLISHINKGVSLINYIGHGNHHTLADEKILEMDRDLNMIESEDYKLPIWIVGTCSFGEYDDKESMAEALLMKEEGAISVISTVRGIGETSNINYLTKFFDNINNYLNDINNNDRLGDILKKSKNNSSSEHLFHLFGDPALPLPFPKINNNLIQDIPDTLFIGEEIIIDIGDNSGYLNVNEKEQNIIRFYETGDSISYNIPGNNIHSNSFFGQGCFITSMDASTCSDCSSMHIYVEDGNNNFIQNIFNLDITEGNQNMSDLDPPMVSFLNNDYRELYDNDIVFLGNSIIIQVEDESGINLMEGLGHNIRYWFNNEDDYHIVRSDEFIYTNTCGDISKGEFQIPIFGLNYGQNKLYVEIWDNFNNRSLEFITLYVEDLSYKAYDVYNFPNPFSEDTYFTFKLSLFPSDITISIFDLNGRKLKEIKQECLDSFCSIYWDGKNNNELINNGTYIYHLKSEYNNQSFEGLYKITILK